VVKGLVLDISVDMLDASEMVYSVTLALVCISAELALVVYPAKVLVPVPS
jgi:hypothetical protein